MPAPVNSAMALITNREITEPGARLKALLTASAKMSKLPIVAPSANAILICEACTLTVSNDPFKVTLAFCGTELPISTGPI
ncbi:hypothetical protein D3C81_1531340 [compost metagenome]